jgi:signal transduction histidine kinase
MKTLGGRVLVLIAGFSLLLATMIGGVGQMTYREYREEMVSARAQGFAERILDTFPDLWQTFNTDPWRLNERLSEFVLFEPNTGLYLLDRDGRVLATAGEARSFWQTYRVDLAQLLDAMHDEPTDPVFGDDPDSIEASALVAARPVIADGVLRGWLYVVARDPSVDPQTAQVMRGHAIQGLVKMVLLTLAIGTLLTVVVIAMLARPLAALTAVAERIRRAGFAAALPVHFPYADREDEIGRLSVTLREMYDRLRQENARVMLTDARRRDMVAGVSHDLRTPLTALIGQLETIRLKGEALSEEQRRRYFDEALQNAGHLRRLTDTLAELGRLDSPDLRISPEPIALGEFVDDVAMRFRARADSAQIALSVNYPDRMPLISLDAALMERALSNLLDNAMRFTPAAGQIRIKIEPAPDRVRIVVADTGPGVPAEDQPKVFDRFFQGSRHREQRGSSGLGLAIVRRIAQLHGGEAGLESIHGQGANFWIELPTRSPQAAGAPMPRG